MQAPWGCNRREDDASSDQFSDQQRAADAADLVEKEASVY
jgi:hypothetical protein